MIEINIRDQKPIDYTPVVLSKLEEMQTYIERAKKAAQKECPYDLEHILYQMKYTLREATEIVNKVSDYYEVASIPPPKKENVILTKPLEPRK